MSCFERPRGGNDYAGEWVISNRFGVDDFKASGATGRFARISAIGRVTGTNSGASISGTLYNGKSFSSAFRVERKDVGKYIVYTNDGYMPSGSKVMVSGYGAVHGNANNPCKANVYSIYGSYFEVWTSDDSSRNDGSFDFVIFTNGWQYDFSSRG